MRELISALVEASKYFDAIVKDKSNPFHKSKYATLDSVLSSVNPSLFAHGLVIIQTLEPSEDCLSLVTRLWHTSGEHVETIHPLPNVQDAQKMGIAITYARRYSICALLNVVADEDTDGQAGKDGKEVVTGTRKEPTITPLQVEELTALATQNGYSMAEMKTVLAGQGFKSRQLVTISAYPRLTTLFSKQNEANAHAMLPEDAQVPGQK